MGFLDDLIGSYRELTNKPVPPPAATDAVKRDAFDQMVWDDVRTSSPAVQRVVDELRVTHDHVEDLAQDVFHLLAKSSPTIRDQAEMRPTHVPNQGMVTGLDETAEVRRLRTMTSGDAYGAAMAFLSMKDQITEGADKLQEARERAQEAQDAEDAAYQASEAAQQAVEAAQAQQDAVDPDDVEACLDAALALQAAADAAAAAQAASAQAANARSQTGDAVTQALAGMREGIRQAATAAEAERQDEADLMAAFGVEDGQLKRMPFAERAALAEALRNNRMAKFAKLLGAWRHQSAAEARKRVAHQPDEVVGVTFGDDLHRLTTQELVNLSTPGLRDDFWLRFTQRNLLVYEVAGTEKLGQGPIVCVVDESQSMETPLGKDGATREAWSKAFVLSLLDSARRQGRDFTYIGFSSASQQWSITFPAGRGPVQDVMTMCEHFFAGGTHYDKPLNMALDVIDGYGPDKPKPDVVFVTDDQGQLPEAFMQRWNRVRDRHSLRCFGIAIGTAVSGVLNAVADNVRSVTDLTASPGDVADVFRTI